MYKLRAHFFCEHLFVNHEIPIPSVQNTWQVDHLFYVSSEIITYKGGILDALCFSLHSRIMKIKLINEVAFTAGSSSCMFSFFWIPPIWSLLLQWLSGVQIWLGFTKFGVVIHRDVLFRAVDFRLDLKTFSKVAL